MSEIVKPISSREWELIRDRVGLILAQELATQAQLDYDDSIFTLPDVFIERYTPFNHTELPAVNVMVADGSYTQETQQTQDGTWTIYIDAYQKGKDADGQRGDNLAMVKLHRLVGMMQAILMDSRFKTLLFEPGSISNRRVTSIKMADPTKAMEASNSVMARIELEVRVSDNVELVDAIPLADYATIAKMSDTGLGYLWSGTSSFTPSDDCDPAVLNVNGVFLKNIPSGEVFNLVVIDTNGTAVGDVYGDTVIVPAQVVDPASVTLQGVSLTDIPGGQTKAMAIYYEGTSDLVPLTPVTDTANTYEATAPAVVTPEITANLPLLTQALNIQDYDEKWHIDNDTFTRTLPASPLYQQLDPTDPTKILHDDSAITGITQHKYRIVGPKGGYYNEADGTYRDINGNLSTENDEFFVGPAGSDYYGICRKTWLGIRLRRGGSSPMPTQLSLAPYTYCGFNDFYIPPISYMWDLADRKDVNLPFYAVDRPPFDIQLSLWSCTYFLVSTSAWYMNTNATVQPVGNSGSRAAMYIRKHIWGTDDAI